MDEENMGWIKIHRKMLKWEWYDDPNTKILFLHLLLKANYKEKKWHGQTIGVGEFVTSIKTLARESTLTVQQVRTSLDRLKSTCEITIRTTNRYSVIKLCNYGLYQELDEDDQHAKQHATQQTNNKQITNKQQTNNKQTTTTKEFKEIKNLKKKKNNINDFEQREYDFDDLEKRLLQN